jgi:hypothetical protein
MADPIDEIIRQAIQRGDFDNLKNSGKKLNLDDYFEMPEDVRVGYTMLKEANFIPAEVELLQEIARIEESLKVAEPGQQEQLRRQIQEKRLKYNILLDSVKKRRG